MIDVLTLTPSRVSKCNDLRKKAEEAAEGDCKAHVKASELSRRRWKMKNHRSEFLSPSDFGAQKEALLSDISAAGVESLNEMGDERAFLCCLYEILMFKLTPLAKLIFGLLYAAF